MIRLNKNKPKKPFVVPEWVALATFIITISSGMVAAIFVPIYFVEVHVTGDAAKVVRNIEQHPEQWVAGKSDHIEGDVYFSNETAGIYVGGNASSDTDPSAVFILFRENGNEAEPFNHGPDRKAIWKALNHHVAGKRSKKEIINNVMKRIEPNQ